VGVPSKDSSASIYTLPLHFEKKLLGSHGGEAIPDVDIPRYVRLCQQGKMSLGHLIGKRYPLEKINDAIEDMRTGAIAGRAVINISPK
jgi:S-(hydroxymethyl)glutathione dehydrogenase/alcohol dehydrogenase